MSTLLSLPQFILCTAYDNFVTEFDELTDHILQVQCSRSSLYDCHIIDPVRSLQIGMLVKLVDDKVSNTIPFQIDHNTGAFLIIRFVVDMCNSFNHFFIDQYTDPVG